MLNQADYACGHGHCITVYPMFLHFLNIMVQTRLHTKNQSPMHIASGLKVCNLVDCVNGI